MDYLYCRHFLVCRTIWYDPAKVGAAFSLGQVVVSLRPGDGSGYPVRERRLFAYAELYGAAGQYAVQVRLVRVENDGYGGDTEVPVKSFEWSDRPVLGDELVEPFAVVLPEVTFPEPGTYEFQLWTDESDEPLAHTRVEAKE